MIFKSVDGSELSLEILGYEFPELVHDIYDLNWLMIHILATNPESTWETVDPFMDTYGAANLYSWFTQIADGNLVPLIVSEVHIEGIDFEVTQITSFVQLMVKNRYYQAVSDHKNLSHATHVYQIALEDFKTATAQWGQEIQKFPKRAHIVINSF